MKISKKDLINKAMEIENSLIKAGFKVKLNNYFAYGAYGYYFDFKSDSDDFGRRQLYTGLGTKKECYNNMVSLYYKALVNENYYKFKDDGETYNHM